MDKKKYIQTVTEQIRCKRALPLVTKELEGHIEDQKSDYMKAGMNVEEAEEAAVLEMGDPVEVGVEMDRIHRPKMAWKMIGLIAILNLAGIVLMYLIRTSILADAGNNPGDVEWIASGIGGNINYLKSVMWTIIGLACMIGICYFDYSRIGTTRSPAVLFIFFGNPSTIRPTSYSSTNSSIRARVLRSLFSLFLCITSTGCAVNCME